MSKAVHKLHVDMQHFRKAESNLKKHSTAEHKAVTAQKTDAAHQKTALAGIQQQEKALIQQVSDEFASGAPVDPALLQKQLGQLVGLGEKMIQTTDAFKTRIAHDKLVAHNNHAAVGKDKKAVKADKKKALHDLKPAEYSMNLKDTNRVRHELGLKKVSHAIRPPAPKLGKVVTQAKKYLGRYESDLQRHGITLPCPTSESCANFVTSMLHKTGEINFRTLGVADLNNKLRARGWHTVSLKNAKPGDVWICNGAHGESHTEIVASNHNGHVTLIGSNNHPVSSNQQINYDTYSANISGSFILAPGK